MVCVDDSYLLGSALVVALQNYVAHQVHDLIHCTTTPSLLSALWYVLVMRTLRSHHPPEAQLLSIGFYVKKLSLNSSKTLIFWVLSDSLSKLCSKSCNSFKESTLM